MLTPDHKGKTFSVVIAEDQVMTAEGLASILQKSGPFKVLAIAQNGEHLLHLLNSVQPDFILLDLNMPVMDGVTACKLIREKFPDIIVVVLTMYGHVKVLKEIKEAGASGMLNKYTSSAELISKLHEILHKKEPFITNFDQHTMVMTGSIAPPDNFLLKYKISKREFEIIRLVAGGMQTEEIAEKLFLSPYTVTTHRKNILTKLNLNNAAE